MNVDIIKVSDLANMAAPYNPRQISDHDLRALRRSLKTFGIVEPIVCNRRTSHIVGGHQRVKAAESEGLESMPVVWVDLGEHAERQLNLALNRISGSWDEPALSRIILDLERHDPLQLKLTGFTGQEINTLLRQAMTADEKRDDQAPLPKRSSKTKPGDVFQLGDNRIICGDSTDPDTWATHVGPVDFVITSPPYNVSIKYESVKDRARIQDYIEFIRSVVRCAAGAMREGRILAWNIGVSPQTAHHRQMVAIEECGLTFHRQIVWQKVGIPYPLFTASVKAHKTRHYKPNYTHEIIGIFSKGKKISYGADRPCSKVYPNDVWRINQAMATRDLETRRERSSSLNLSGGSSKTHLEKSHPASFPVDLPRIMIDHFAGDGEVICDPFVGSGATIIAAERAGVSCVGIEIDPVYVDVAVSRWEKFTGEKAERCQREN